jgi:cytochrome c biogenesis factor
VHAAVVIVIIAIAISSSIASSSSCTSRKGNAERRGLRALVQRHRGAHGAASTFDHRRLPSFEERQTARAPRAAHESVPDDAEPIGSPDVHTTALRDVYISLSNVDTINQTASITVFISPLIVWIWLPSWPWPSAHCSR